MTQIGKVIHPTDTQIPLRMAGHTGFCRIQHQKISLETCFEGSDRSVEPHRSHFRQKCFFFLKSSCVTICARCDDSMRCGDRREGKSTFSGNRVDSVQIGGEKKAHFHHFRFDPDQSGPVIFRYSQRSPYPRSGHEGVSAGLIQIERKLGGKSKKKSKNQK